jgi:hypothetical protein
MIEKIKSPLVSKCYRCKAENDLSLMRSTDWGYICSGCQSELKYTLEYRIVKCPIQWFCKKLNRSIEVSDDAVFNPKFGWLCDCGQWIKKEDIFHTDVIFGKREACFKIKRKWR